MSNSEPGFRIAKTFSTPLYQGAWFSFSGDRFDLRKRLQEYLRNELQDSEGLLLVQDQGPEWHGSRKINMSYSHSGDFALLVWMTTRQIGVDLEKKDREYSHPLLQLAKRFFHEAETKALEKKAGTPDDLSASFLDLWLKKEAYAKLTRNGLKDSIHTEINTLSDVFFETVPLIPVGYDARVAIR